MLKRTIRAATVEDAEFLAWVMLSAFRSHLTVGIWDIGLPGPEHARLDFLKALCSTPTDHMAHWSRFLIAEVDGEPAAALSAYETSQHDGKPYGKGFRHAARDMGWDEQQLEGVRSAMAFALSIDYPKNYNCWIIEWVACKADFRGQGLVLDLMNEILSKGRNLGFTKTQIGCFLGNLPAKNLYQKVGFQVVSAHVHQEFEAVLGIPGIELLEMEL